MPVQLKENSSYISSFQKAFYSKKTLAALGSAAALGALYATSTFEGKSVVNITSDLSHENFSNSSSQHSSQEVSQVFTQVAYSMKNFFNERQKELALQFCNVSDAPAIFSEKEQRAFLKLIGSIDQPTEECLPVNNTVISSPVKEEPILPLQPKLNLPEEPIKLFGECSLPSTWTNHSVKIVPTPSSSNLPTSKIITGAGILTTLAGICVFRKESQLLLISGIVWAQMKGARVRELVQKQMGQIASLFSSEKNKNTIKDEQTVEGFVGTASRKRKAAEGTVRKANDVLKQKALLREDDQGESPTKDFFNEHTKEAEAAIRRAYKATLLELEEQQKNRHDPTVVELANLVQNGGAQGYLRPIADSGVLRTDIAASTGNRGSPTLKELTQTFEKTKATVQQGAKAAKAVYEIGSSLWKRVSE